MKELLFVSCIIREQSRTRELAEAFLSALDSSGIHVTKLDLTQLGLIPIDRSSLEERDRLLSEGNLSHPRFDLAHQFQEADYIVIAAPYWDMSFPSLLKVYVEHISVEGITFASDETGLHGLCRAEKLILLTTRGGFTETYSEDDQASSYFRTLGRLLGYRSFECIGASGMDVFGFDAKAALDAAKREAEKTAGALPAE